MIKFGTGGFRGIINEDFNELNVKKISHGIANHIYENNLKKQVVISYDLRDKSYESALLVANVLTSYNISVIFSKEATPSPVAMFITEHYKLDIGIMITASHNPANYNGIKVFETGGYDASVITTTNLEKLSNKEYLDKPQNDSLIQITNILEEYNSYLKGFINIKPSNIKILFDFIYGVGSKTIPTLLNDYGLKNVEYRRIDRDDNYYNVNPNPTEENLRFNKDTNNFDLTIGIDADADRLGIIDDLGNFVDSNEILALIYYYFIKYKGLKGAIVKNISTSNLIDNIAKSLGEEVYTTDVGFKNITSKMKEVDALLGGESSGGLTIRNYIKGKDSTLASLLIIEILTVLDKPLSELIKTVRQEADFFKKTVEKEFVYKDQDVINTFIENDKLKIDTNVIDKIKYNTNYKYFLSNDEWVLLRFSGTEPLIRVLAETDNIEFSESIVNSIIRQLEGI